MSVINQMLKDLEQRSPEQGHVPNHIAATSKPSTVKIVVISAIVLLSLNAVGFYIWSLQTRIEQNESTLLKAPVEKELVEKQATTIQTAAITPSTSSQVKIAQSVNVPVGNAVKESALFNKQANIETDKEVIKEAKVQVEQKVITPVPIEVELTSAEVLADASKVIPTTNSKMSVSRRQLSPAELVQQKLVKAEKSLEINEVAKAELLFEDILIIDPHNKQARKKLAALLFGRKSYQQANNLLAQGIALDKNDGELRLMKARIHLKQGRAEAAYDTLKPLNAFKNQEYQLMLANIAQQIKQYTTAIDAYKVLIKMQPHSGRWHLGLAIVYDKTSQFSQALNEYAIALSKTDLSVSSAKFVQQRMKALGE